MAEPVAVGAPVVASASNADDIPLGPLPGEWQSLLCGGQVLTALILSTSFSEKYKGRGMYPGRDDTATVRLPSANGVPRCMRPVLLHRSGNKEAVAYIWLGDAAAEDRTIYVAFSPMRYRSQFCKIYCAGMVQDVSDTDLHVASTPGGRNRTFSLPISSYIHVKLKRMWGKQGLWKNLSSMVDKYKDYRVVFAGISHGAALAQAAALQFRMRKPAADTFVVTWNAYRWTNELGSATAKEELGDRLLCFVLSRRGAEPSATRYWDSVAGFPPGYAPMPNLVLLDADTGAFLVHTAPERPSTFGAVTLMRVFELHFAKCAISATKKSTESAVGGTDLDDFLDGSMFGKPLAEKFQEKVLETSDHMVQAGQHIRRAASTEFNQAMQRISAANERASGRFPGRSSSSIGDSARAGLPLPRMPEEPQASSCLRWLAWCHR